MGRIRVVGIGPGDPEDMTLRAVNALRDCDVIVGYTAYVDLVKPLFPGKQTVSTPMRGEVERCRRALVMAREGREVAVVCSGDAGVYGMAGLLYELRGGDDAPEIEVVGGLTAALSGAALLGAPLANDFAVISLSDLLTPWEVIEKRLESAAAGDFAVVLYNPGSSKRRDSLRRACDVLLRRREGERIELMSLAELREYNADMFTTVFVGNSRTRAIGGKMVTPRGYRDV